jgi:hypothetical protein
MWNMGMWLDSHWKKLDRQTKQRLLKALEHIMLSANHNRASGLWKLGDSLGCDIATTSARRILEKVIQQATNREALESALHGLAHYAYDHPRSKASVCLLLSRIAKRRSRSQYKQIIRATVTGIRKGYPCG